MTGAASSRPDANAKGDEPTDGPDAFGDPNELAQTLSELARSLEAEDNTESMLNDLVAAAVAQITGLDEGSISVVVQRRDVSSQSPSSDLPRRVDALQIETGQGPCLDAVYKEKVVTVPDMASETRWPEFAHQAAQAEAACMLSFQLWVGGDNPGALNLYGREPDAFTEESEHVGLLFVSHAAVARASAQKHDQMAEGLSTRDLIGQAESILMERSKIDANRAPCWSGQASTATASSVTSPPIWPTRARSLASLRPPLARERGPHTGPAARRRFGPGRAGIPASQSALDLGGWRGFRTAG